MLVGRAQERAHIDRLLADGRVESSSPLVMSGEAGIGETALLDYAAGGQTTFASCGRSASRPSLRLRSPGSCSLYGLY